jgi:hypothetical protein
VHQLAETLAAAIPAATPDDHRAVAQRLTALDAVEHEFDGVAWARVVRALPSAAWSDDELAHAARLAGSHSAPLRFALLEASARRGDGDARTQLLNEATDGSIDALGALGDVRELPSEVVAAHITKLNLTVAEIVTDAREGKHRFGGHDPAHTLLLLNVWHPEVAAWDAAIALLQEPGVAASTKRRSLRLLIQMADRIAEPIRARLRPIAAWLARGADTATPDIFDGRSIAGEAASLAVALGAWTDEEAALQLVGLLGGDSADRLMAATLARQVVSSEQVGVLAALAGDQVPDVRAAAAEGLSLRLADGDNSVLVLQALRAGLEDPGTLVPIAIARALREASDPVVLEFRERLRTNASAYVRSLAPSSPEGA